MASGVLLFVLLGLDAGERDLEFEPSSYLPGGKIKKLGESLKGWDRKCQKWFHVSTQQGFAALFPGETYTGKKKFSCSKIKY